jgi:hypothetical protein
MYHFPVTGEHGNIARMWRAGIKVRSTSNAPKVFSPQPRGGFRRLSIDPSQTNQLMRLSLFCDVTRRRLVLVTSFGTACRSSSSRARWTDPKRRKTTTDIRRNVPEGRSPQLHLGRTLKSCKPIDFWRTLNACLSVCPSYFNVTRLAVMERAGLLNEFPQPGMQR